MVRRAVVQCRRWRSMCQPRPPATPSQPTSRPTWSPPPAPAPRTHAAITISIPASRPSSPPLRASASTASASSTRPRNCPAPCWRISSGARRRAPARRRVFSSPPRPKSHAALCPGAPQAQGNHRHAEQPPGQQPGGVERPCNAPRPSSHQARIQQRYWVACAPSSPSSWRGRRAWRICCQNEASAGRRKIQHVPKPCATEPLAQHRASGLVPASRGHPDRVEDVLYFDQQGGLNGVAAGRAHYLHRDPVDREVRPEQPHLAPPAPEQGQKSRLFPAWADAAAPDPPRVLAVSTSAYGTSTGSASTPSQTAVASSQACSASGLPCATPAGQARTSARRTGHRRARASPTMRLSEAAYRPGQALQCLHLLSSSRVPPGAVGHRAPRLLVDAPFDEAQPAPDARSTTAPHGRRPRLLTGRGSASPDATPEQPGPRPR